jgi:hypothetical protein
MSSILGSIISSGGGGGGTVDDAQLALKADLAYVDTQLGTKAPTNTPTFTGTVALPEATTYNGTNLNQTLNTKTNLTEIFGDEYKLKIKIGDKTGESGQGNWSVAIGFRAGQTSQSPSAVALGENSGNENQGSHSIAIGNRAGQTNQAVRSIVINATGLALQNTIPDSCVVAPIRAQDVGSHILTYNDTTKEVVKSTIAQLNTLIDAQIAAAVGFEERLTALEAQATALEGGA